MKKLLLLPVMMLFSSLANAYDIEVKNDDGVTIYYKYINDGKELEVTRGNYSGCVKIPEEVTSSNITRKVTNIGLFAFMRCVDLTSVKIPQNVTNIGYGAFSGCTALSSLDIPNNVVSIENEAFKNCSSLTSFVIPNGLKTIGYNAFLDCSKLTSFIFPESLTSIEEGAFEGTAWYNNQPQGLVYAGNVMYKYKGFMPNNTNIVLQSGTISISGGAFADCSGLTSITIPNSLKSIGDDAFYGCSNLISISIPDGVTYIGGGAFFDCSGLSSLSIPNSLTSIGGYVFYGCSNLISLTIPNSVKEIGDYSFYGCSNLNSLTIPNSVMQIGDYSFYGCSSLNTLSIPSSVTRIGDYSFYGCSNLNSLSIPGSVTRIGEYSFANCSNLTSIKVYWNIPLAIYENTFDLNSIQRCTLYVPIGSKSEYKSVSVWSSFTNINEIMDETNPENYIQKINYMTVKEAKTLIDGSKKYLFVEGYAGKYTLFYTVIGGGTITTEKYEYLVVSDEPNFDKNTRGDKDILSYNAILVGVGDTWLSAHSDLIKAINLGKRIRIQAIESWVNTRSYSMKPTKYEIINEDEITAITPNLPTESSHSQAEFYSFDGMKKISIMPGFNIVRQGNQIKKIFIK